MLLFLNLNRVSHCTEREKGRQQEGEGEVPNGEQSMTTGKLAAGYLWLPVPCLLSHASIDKRQSHASLPTVQTHHTHRRRKEEPPLLSSVTASQAGKQGKTAPASSSSCYCCCCFIHPTPKPPPFRVQALPVYAPRSLGVSSRSRHCLPRLSVSST